MLSKILFGAFALVTVGCAKTGGYQPAQPQQVQSFDLASVSPSQLMPLRQGDQWVFALQVQGVSARGTRSIPSADVTFRVTNVDKTANGDVATIEISTNETVSETQKWLENDKGIYQLAVGPKVTPFSSPQPVALWPLEDGKTFNWSGTGLLSGSSDTGPMTVSCEVHAPQTVDTQMGQMVAVPIDSTAVFTVKNVKTVAKTTIWLAPNVGLVRMAQSVANDAAVLSQTLRLKNSSLKKG